MEKKRQGLAKGRRKEQKKRLIFRETVESEEAKKRGVEFYFSREKGKGLSFLSKKEKGGELLAIVGQPMTLSFLLLVCFIFVSSILT